METTQTIPNVAIMSDKMFDGSSKQYAYLWKNLKIEEQSSENLIQRLFKKSGIGAFWLTLRSPAR